MSILKWPWMQDEIVRNGVWSACASVCVDMSTRVCVCACMRFADLELKTMKAGPGKLFR